MGFDMTTSSEESLSAFLEFILQGNINSIVKSISKKEGWVYPVDTTRVTLYSFKVKMSDGGNFVVAVLEDA